MAAKENIRPFNVLCSVMETVISILKPYHNCVQFIWGSSFIVWWQIISFYYNKLSFHLYSVCIFM